MINGKLSSTKIAVIALVIVISIFGYWVWSKITWTEKKVDRGYSELAIYNRFLAAGLFLDRFDIDSKVTFNRALLNGLGAEQSGQLIRGERDVNSEKVGVRDSIVFIDGRGTLRGERFENTWRWIEAGGTLIYSAQNPFIGKADTGDDLFDRLGIWYWGDGSSDDWSLENRTERDDETDAQDTDLDTLEKAASENATAENEVDTDPVADEDDPGVFQLNADYCYQSGFTELNMEGFEEPLLIDFWDSVSLEIDRDNDIQPRATVIHNSDVFFAQYNIGEGKVFVSIDNKIWENRRIHCGDHALFLAQLVNPDGRVWFMVNRDAPSLLAVFWRQVPILIVLFPVLILLWLWSTMPRFGPIFTEENITRRSFSEHLSASANFVWKNKKQAILVERVRADLEIRFRQKDARYEEFDTPEKTTYVETLTGLDRKKIYVAMYKPAEEIYLEFVEVIANLKLIKEKL